MPAVSARRKYVSWRGDVVVTPERMTKKIITIEPARKIRATPPSDGSARQVSMLPASLTVCESREDLRPAMIASGTGIVRSAEERLLWPRGIGDGVLRER